MIYKSCLYNLKSIYKGNGVYNPVSVLPNIEAKTIRFEFSNLSYDPTVAGVGSSGTWNKIENRKNIWDWTNTNNNWSASFDDAFQNGSNIVSILGFGDLTGVSDMTSMFRRCYSLKSVPKVLAPSVTSMASAFLGCTSLENSPYIEATKLTNVSSLFNGCSTLKNIILFDTSKLKNVSWMFYGCRKVENGALAFYTQLSTQTTPPSSHTDTFKNCGADTENGSMELAQIPSSWGGTGT